VIVTSFVLGKLRQRCFPPYEKPIIMIIGIVFYRPDRAYDLSTLKVNV